MPFFQRPSRSRSHNRRRWLAVALSAVVLGSLPATATSAPQLEVDRYHPQAPRAVSGWRADFVEEFQGPLDVEVWGRYHGGPQVGTHSSYDRANAYVDQGVQVDDGVLQLTTRKTDGSWTSAGLSSGRGFSATQGKWVIKAKFDRAPGVGYAFLLYPKGGGWPPEIDIAEGTMGGKHIMSTFHHGPNNTQEQRWLHGLDMTKWHTYGVIIDGDVIEFTVDGRTWGTVTHENTPRIPMWIGMQAGVKDCAQSTGECLSDATPMSSNISVDWIAHYEKV